MYVCTEAVHTYIAKRASSSMYGPVQAISLFTNRSKSGCKSEPFRNACKNFLDCIAAAGLSIPLFRRQQKGWQPVLLGTNCQPFFVAYAALQGHFVVRRAGRNCPTQLPSAAQRYNTLDFGSKVVCHETPGRFLWILPATIHSLFFSNVFH